MKLAKLWLAPILGATAWIGPSAHAATCSHHDTQVEITLSSEAGTLSFTRTGAIRLNKVLCGDATLANTESITITGGAGDEKLVVSGPWAPIAFKGDLGPGRDTVLIIGTDGPDTLRCGDWVADDAAHGIAGVEVVQLEGLAGDDLLDCRSVSSTIEQAILRGDDGDDTIYGSPVADFIYGGAGNDQLHGGAGADRINAGDGDDQIFGDDGNDVLTGGNGNDMLFGGEGNDVFQEGLAASGADLIDGGPGVDTANYSGRNNAVTLVSHPGSDAPSGDSGEFGEGDFIRDVERLIGGAGNDTLRGLDSVDYALTGGPGDDTLIGNSGKDTLVGGAGADHLEGRGGDDILLGGDGDDTIDGGAGTDLVRCGEGVDTFTDIDAKRVPADCEHVASASSCGDGKVDAGEQCDDHNTDDGDGCNASCQVEAGYQCYPWSPSYCVPICGDGIVTRTEDCDDGNNNDGDGCDYYCNHERNYTCSGSPSVCTPVGAACTTALPTDFRISGTLTICQATAFDDFGCADQGSFVCRTSATTVHITASADYASVGWPGTLTYWGDTTYEDQGVIHVEEDLKCDGHINRANGSGGGLVDLNQGTASIGAHCSYYEDSCNSFVPSYTEDLRADGVATCTPGATLCMQGTVVHCDSSGKPVPQACAPCP